ncbi:hypothetical protein [Actinacidiphila sp. ITFR-21]|uniref:hypothetical protein n=1 Tax=Actinacidiphila sp. ITFR-21 TaxID=3075199 RepID=UPI00288C401F|nr:hypothetical protein [Streptomyces sp. ITFR-21]WNI20403.1 hypothetical protein RLT57_32895 [Streptomyces sp. ITFR-21]
MGDNLAAVLIGLIGFTWWGWVKWLDYRRDRWMHTPSDRVPRSQDTVPGQRRPPGAPE